MKKNRQSVIVDDQKFHSNSKIKDKTKSRIFDAGIKEEEFNESNISKKARKTFIKEASGFQNDISSQRTDKICPIFSKKRLAYESFACASIRHDFCSVFSHFKQQIHQKSSL